MHQTPFHPLIEQWFEERFREPTEAQRRGWPEIAAGRNALIAAPTGSGKTLAAFLVCIDQLFRQGIEGALEDETQVIYISPLKALSNDIRRNLETPLAEISERAAKAGLPHTPKIRALVRTGDTPMHERTAMLKKPPAKAGSRFPNSCALRSSYERGKPSSFAATAESSSAPA